MGEKGTNMIEKLKQYTNIIKRELKVYQLVIKDPRTPWAARGLLGIAIGYLLLPFDLIPDFIPLMGQLDDLILVPGLVWLALRMIPPEIIEESRREVKLEME